jgi:outer membrane protein OmpA-like peptidoglycan-associated protein
MKLKTYVQTPLAAAVVLVLGGCGAPSWEKQYERISDPIMKEYTELADKISSDVYSYRFQFSLEPVSNSNVAQTGNPKLASASNNGNAFLLHARYQGNDLVTLDDEAKNQLEKRISPIRGMKDLKIHVVGHTDNVAINPRLRAQYADNKALSLARAKNVADYLKETLHLDASAISYSGMADQQPKASNASAQGRAQNRRVEVAVNTPNAPAVVAAAPDSPVLVPKTANDEVAPMPADYAAWWRPMVQKPFNANAKPVFTSMDDLILRGVKHSAQVKVFSDLPLIRRTAIDEAEGRFDTHLFLEGKYAHTNEPVGTTLQTGQPGRFVQDERWLRAGARQPFKSGGELEISERIGTLNNNSQYLIPPNQGNSRFAVTFRQPVLNGAGFQYNESTIAVAKVDHSISEDEFSRQVQAHLLEIQRAYWGVYLERAILLQKKKLLADTEKIVADLKARRGVDTLESQVVEANAAVATRRSDSIRSEQAVRNAEGKLLALINDPSLVITHNFELVPTSMPLVLPIKLNLKDSVTSALKVRPEINQAFKQLKAGVIRAEMSKNELLPVLNLILEGYVGAIEKDKDYNLAASNQFKDPSKPSYSVGFLFDLPLGNTVARARDQRRRLEVRQLIDQLRTTIETVMLEVQVAVREVDTSYRELNSKYHAMIASAAKLDTLKARRSVLNNENGELRNGFLQRLLDSQGELTNSEQAFLTSYIAYNIAQINLQRAQGTLLQVNKLQAVESEEDSRGDDKKLPVLQLRREIEEEQKAKLGQ